MLKNKYELEFAERIFRQIEGFSEYGFPESHAASFALLVYVSAWLKRYYPAAFLCGLLNSLPMGFYSASQLVQDAQRHGVKVLPVDVLHSDWDNTLEREPAPSPRPHGADGDAGWAVRLGLRQIKGLGKAAAEQLLAARPSGGFADLDALWRRSGMPRSDLECLAAAGALQALAGHRRNAWWQVSGLDAGKGLTEGAVALDTTPELAAPTLGQDIVADYASTELTLRPHPLTLLRAQLRRERLLTAAEILNLPDGRLARAAGIVTTRQRPGTASGVTFVTLEDETGNLNIIVWRDLGDRQRRELLSARLLAVFGVVQREGEVVHLLAKRLVDKSELLGTLRLSSRDFH